MNRPLTCSQRKWLCFTALVAALLLLVWLMPASASPSAGSGVIINEFAPKDSPEWIELYNAGPTDQNLTGWTLTDGSGTVDTLSGILAAGTYTMVNNSFALSNSGDEIFLFDSNGTLVDHVAYGNAGGAPLAEPGHSVARLPGGTDTNDDARDWNLDPSPTAAAANDVPAVDLGASLILNEFDNYPGSGNPDRVELYNPTPAAIDLAGWMLSDGDSLQVLSGGLVPAGGFYVLTEGVDFNTDFSGSDVAYLFQPDGVRVDQIGFSGEFEDQCLARVPDGAGPNDGYNWDSSGGGTTFLDQTCSMGSSNVLVPPPGAGDLLINEFIATPTSAEAVELCNTTDADIDVGGWTLEWGSGSATLNAGLVVPADGYLVIDDSNTTGITIPNAGAVLALKNDAGELIDRVGYGRSGGAPKPDYQASTGRSPNCTDTDNDAADFNYDPTPTLGMANDAPATALGSTPVRINEVDPNTGTGTAFIELYNAGDGEVDIGGWAIGVDDVYTVPAGERIPPHGFWTLDETDFPRYFSLTAGGDNVYLYDATGARVDQVGWNAAPGSSWNRVPDGTGAVDGYEQTHTPLYALSPTRGATNTTAVPRIHDVQGAGHLSPMNGIDIPPVPGIVTVVRSSGFYMQDPEPDNDIATSEGIFVYTGSAPGVNVGDFAFVAGTVTEYYPGGVGTGNLSTTEIVNPTITVVSNGNPLPMPTIIGLGGRFPPPQVIDNDATGNVETSGTFDPLTDGIDFYESLEGMLLQVNNALVVGPTSRFGEITVLGDGGANAAVRTARGGIVIRPNDFNPERIIIDDAIVRDEPQVNVGDFFTEPITGVLAYSFGNFKLLNPVPLPAPASGGVDQEVAADPRPAQLTVAAFNVENLDPGDDVAKFEGLATEIVTHLRAPDIIALVEVQDNSGPADDGVTDASDTYNMLIAAIQAAGGPTYAFRDIPPEDGQDGGQPGGNIRVGFLFRPDRVTFIDRPGGTATAATEVVPGPTGPELTFSPGRIDPTHPAFVDGRKSLVGEFLFHGHKLFVIANHFKSKRGDDPLFGRNQPPTRVTDDQRAAQAQVINDFVDRILALDPDANIIVLGDLNDFEFSSALTVLKGEVLTNLVEVVPLRDRYTFIFDGNSEVLDHILVSPNLVHRANAELDIVHVNADFAVSGRASDHDPVLARFTLAARVVIPLVVQRTAFGPTYAR